jgi:hypothetical protein
MRMQRSPWRLTNEKGPTTTLDPPCTRIGCWSVALELWFIAALARRLTAEWRAERRDFATGRTGLAICVGTDEKFGYLFNRVYGGLGR